MEPTKTGKKLRKLQLAQLLILKKIDKLCIDNGLAYYLVGGTLLGAIRHQGFIPWDDDLDIAMYRDDYNRLQEILKEQYTEELFLQTPSTDKNYNRQIAKIRLRGTYQVEKNLSNIEMNHGIYIDIFPLDYVRKDRGIALFLRGKLIRILFAYNTMRSGKKTKMSLPKQIIKAMTTWITYLIPRRFVSFLFDYLCTMDNKKECEYTTSFLSGYGWKKQLHSNDVYGGGVKVNFEGNLFNAPEKYEKVLSSLYGDYMKLPPLEKRHSGHKLCKINFGKYDDKLEEVLINERRDGIGDQK